MSVDRIERRARELLRTTLAEEEFAAYERLGFFSVPGRGDPASGYAYLVYPHRPLVAYETLTGRLLSEYCVRFRDDRGRLPDVNPPGHQVDPDHVRRDLALLARWRSERAVDSRAP